MQFFLGDAIFWVAVACCTVAEVAIVRSALVVHLAGSGRRKAGDEILSPRRWTEVAWTILPAIALAVVLALTWRAVRDARLGTHDAVPAVHPSGVVS